MTLALISCINAQQYTFCKINISIDAITNTKDLRCSTSCTDESFVTIIIRAAASNQQINWGGCLNFEFSLVMVCVCGEESSISKACMCII